MADNNNFKQLLFQELQEMPEAPGQVENGVDGSIGFISHIGKFIELYIPKFIDAITAFLGSNDRN
ncbi:MAG: hypothetical protein KJP00_04985 [Bacteroidia bacterium]|nr:hypothetical protein [Bacteroidia bacterium]